MHGNVDKRRLRLPYILTTTTRWIRTQIQGGSQRSVGWVREAERSMMTTLQSDDKNRRTFLKHLHGPTHRKCGYASDGQ